MKIRIPKDANIRSSYKNWKNDPIFEKCWNIVEKIGDEDPGYIKIGNGLTGEDYQDIAYFAHSDEHLNDKDNSYILKLIKMFGEIPTMTLYRGCSDKEKESILNAKTSILAYPYSFSEKKEIARRYGNNIITVRKCNKPMFNLSKWLTYNDIIAEINDPGFTDTIDSNEDSNEFEWIIPAKTKFTIIDKDKLIFEIK